jgi:hypothetical protein
MPGKNSKLATVKTETPVAPKVEETKEAAPAPAPQKGGKKAAPAKVEEAKVEAASAPVAVAPASQKGGKKAAPAKVEETKAESVAAPTVQKGGKGKKAAKPKAVKAKKEENEEEGEDGEKSNNRIRSFKVRLPGKEVFEGRFTGLTPYQAANKALSKYFRETSEPKTEITFSICESTRKSKKSVYTYAGKRLKLDTPVTYTIQDGREIVKNFKNFLKKVKKSDTATV